MDENHVRRGIIQAKLIEDTSGLLWVEILFVPLLLSFQFAKLRIVSPNWDIFAVFGVGFISFIVFIACTFNSKARFWMAIFFSCIWAYGVWKLFGLVIHDRPFSAYGGKITHFIIDNGFRAIPSVFIFILTILLHTSDFQWIDDVRR